MSEHDTDPAPGADLVGFLLARIAEDERAAQAATGPRWVPAVSPGAGTDRVDAWLVALPGRGYGDGPGATVATVAGPSEQAHLVRWDPARVLAECALRRRLVQRGADHDPDLLVELATLWAHHPDHPGG